jgi:hypothetical protein
LTILRPGRKISPSFNERLNDKPINEFVFSRSTEEGNRMSREARAKPIERKIFLLLLALSFNGCKESPSLVKEGPLFTTTEKTPSSRALVYVYWPRQEKGQRKHIWVGPCEEGIQEILPGSYRAFVMKPGPNCLHAERISELAHIDAASVIQDLGSVELIARPDHPAFVRVEQKPVFLISGTVLRPVNPAVADPEIKRCRQLVPLTDEEMIQVFSREDQ